MSVVLSAGSVDRLSDGKLTVLAAVTGVGESGCEVVNANGNEGGEKNRAHCKRRGRERWEAGTKDGSRQKVRLTVGV
jgi:hypothetical protein